MLLRCWDLYCGLGWGGVGGDVNVPCTSYLKYCYAAEISGIVYYVTCCYAAETSSVGWGGVGWGGGDVNVPFTSYLIYCYAAEISGIVYYVTCCYAAETSSVGWGGVGWGGVGGMLTFLVLRTWYIATLLRSLGSFTTLHVATLLRPLVWVGVGWVPSNLSAKSDLLMVYARAWQWRCIHKNADCQLFTTHALQRWSWKRQKRAASFSRLSNQQIGTALW